MQIIRCTYQKHADAMLGILNEAIVNTTALYDYEPRTIDDMRDWFQKKQSGGFPIIGIIDENNTLLGFATYGTFRAWPAYKYTVEHSVYVDKKQRGNGIGETLMQHLIAAAKEQQMHVIVGCIDASNEASVAFHEKLGFQRAGTMPQVGFKFGRWLDLALYQLILETPIDPQDG